MFKAMFIEPFKSVDFRYFIVLLLVCSTLGTIAGIMIGTKWQYPIAFLNGMITGYIFVKYKRYKENTHE